MKLWKFSKEKTAHAPKALSVTRDWGILLFAFVILGVFSLLFAVYVYFQISRGEFYVVISKDAIDEMRFDEELLKKTVDFYRGRGVRLEALKTESLGVADPSL